MVCSVLVIAGSTDVQLGVGITVVVVVQEYLDCKCGGRHGDGMRCGVWEVVGGAPSDKGAKSRSFTCRLLAVCTK